MYRRALLSLSLRCRAHPAMRFSTRRCAAIDASIGFHFFHRHGTTTQIAVGHSPFSSSAHDPDFEARAKQFGLASKEEVAAAAKDPNTIWLDVRSPIEIQEASLTARSTVSCWCTMDDTSRLAEQADQLLPDKDATIVIFCAVGGRASVAKACLESMGYTKVLNAGGLCDLDNIQ